MEDTPEGALSLHGLLKIVHVKPADLEKPRDIALAFRVSGDPGEQADMTWALVDSANHTIATNKGTVTLPADNDFLFGVFRQTIILRQFGRHSVFVFFGDREHPNPVATWFELHELTVH